MIRVPQRGLGDHPGLLPGEIIFVNEHAHQFGDGHGWMCVIELNGDLGSEGLKGGMGLQISFDNIADSTGDEKVLLDEPELLARLNRIRGIQHLGDRFRGNLLLYRLEIIPGIENLHVKLRRSARRVQPQVIHGLPAIAYNREIMGDTDEDFPIHPHGIVLPIAVECMLNASVHRNKAGFINALDLPWRPRGEPVVRSFLLVAIIDLLLKETILIVNAIAIPRHVQGGQGVQETGRQTTEAAIAQGGIALALLHHAQLHSEGVQRFLTQRKETEIIQVVAQRAAHEKLDGQIVYALGLCLTVALFSSQHAIHQLITHGEGHRPEQFRTREGLPLFAQ